LTVKHHRFSSYPSNFHNSSVHNGSTVYKGDTAFISELALLVSEKKDIKSPNSRTSDKAVRHTVRQSHDQLLSTKALSNIFSFSFSLTLCHYKKTPKTHHTLMHCEHFPVVSDATAGEQEQDNKLGNSNAV